MSTENLDDLDKDLDDLDKEETPKERLGSIYWNQKKKAFVHAGRAIKSPAEMWAHACDYFALVDEEKFEKQDFIRGGERAGQIVKMNTIKPYTWQGFDAYLRLSGIITSVREYKGNRDGRYEEYADVMKTIGDVIFSKNFDGAAVGAFSAVIIARQLGLAEKTINENTSEVKLDFDYTKLSETALEEIASQLDLENKNETKTNDQA